MPQVIIWPEYFNSRLTRREGRRVPLNLAVKDPSKELFLKACEKLGIKCSVEEGKYYPRIWYRSLGFMVIAEVSEDVRKTKLIRMLAEEINKMVERRS